MPLEHGVVFAGFVIERFLGSGAMGEVYLARHPRLQRLDALKVLPAALTDNAEFRRRFEREVDVAATLWHPHIVGIHDRGEFHRQLWISSDYVEGTDAGRLLSDHYPSGMPVGEVLDIVTAVAEALDFAHQRQLRHADIKPSNVLLTAEKSNWRRILLSDFGVAQWANEAAGLTRTNMSVGSVGYAAPEQLAGERLDGRADQYALAATAFHLLTARMPFQHSNPAVVISNHLRAAVPRLGESRPELGHLDRALSVALAKDRNHRYPRCLDFAEALRRESAQPHTRPIPSSADAPKPAVPSQVPTSKPVDSKAITLPPDAATHPDKTRAIKLRPDAVVDSDETRAIYRRPGGFADADETRAMKLRPGAAGEPDETRAIRVAAAEQDETRPMEFRKSIPSEPDATRAMNLRPRAVAEPDETRTIRLRQGAAAGSDETTRLDLSSSATASPQFQPAQPARPPAEVAGSGRGAADAHLFGGGPSARQAPKESRNLEFRKAIWILVAVVVLVVAVLAAGVVWWKVFSTDGPSRHGTVGESSMPQTFHTPDWTIDPKLVVDDCRHAHGTAICRTASLTRTR
jgi:serine/threonine protein kinase